MKVYTELDRRRFMQTFGRYLVWGAGFVEFHDSCWDTPYSHKIITEKHDHDVSPAEIRVIDRAIAEWNGILQ